MNLTQINFLLIAIALLLPGCGKQQEQDATKDDLKEKAIALYKKNKVEDASAALETLVAKYPDDPQIHTYKLALADMYFKQSNYPSSFTMYEHYSTYYPAEKKAEYAQYHSILSKFYQTLRADCDQTATEETIQLCKQYLDRLVHQKYRKDVADIQNTCEHKLINKEIYVYNFYLKQGQYEAAKIRLNNLKQQYLLKKKTIEPQLLYLECKLANQKNDAESADLMKKNLEELTKRYPDSQYTHMAEAIVSPQKFIF